MAPELLIDNRKTTQIVPEAVDLYSFGVTMWACLSKEHPYRDDVMSRFSIWTLRDQIVAGDRPSLKYPVLSGAPYRAMELMQQCWDNEPSRRPVNFREVCQVLCKCIESETQRFEAAIKKHSASISASAPSPFSVVEQSEGGMEVVHNNPMLSSAV